MTDKNGEFLVPKQRIFAFRAISGWDRHPQFTIFKPGYGPYPMHKGAMPMFDYGSIPADQQVTLELPPLKTFEERREQGIPSVNGSVPYDKQIGLINLINQERQTLGYPGKIGRKAWELNK